MDPMRPSLNNVTTMHFPMKLYELVEAGPANVVCWSESGSSFLIANPELFCNEILPKHFRHNKLTSFQRQLNLYGFQRIPKGAEAGRYRHPLFQRGRPDLLSMIKREPRTTSRPDGPMDSKLPSPAFSQLPVHPMPPVAGHMYVTPMAAPDPTHEAFASMREHPSHLHHMAYNPYLAPPVPVQAMHGMPSVLASPSPHSIPSVKAESMSMSPPIPKSDADAALAMLKISRSMSESNMATSARPMDDEKAAMDDGSDDEDDLGPPAFRRPPCRKSASDSQLTQKLQSRCSSLEQEVRWLKNQVVGLNRTIEILAGGVGRNAFSMFPDPQMRLGNQKKRMRFDEHMMEGGLDEEC